MCDTIVAVPPATVGGGVLFGKNSDREPGEAQLVEHLPAARHNAAAPLQCTYVKVPQTEKTHEVLLSRPFWMWGAEMGVNEHGLAIGNEAVWTKLPAAKTGLTGMDLLRLALERATCAREALELITRLLKEVGQGGECGYRKKNFRYHNAFILADPQEAWVLETAGEYWAAVKVRGIRTISNALSIGREFDLLGDGTFEFARSQGWCRNAADFDFAESFGHSLYRLASGGNVRRLCTHAFLQRNAGALTREDFMAALRDHAGQSPADGWRMVMPCAHAAWWPTRQAGQTTASMVSELKAGKDSLHWLTGTSSPCLSVFKPVRLGEQLLDAGPQPAARADEASLFWQHEKLHRNVLADYEIRHSIFLDARTQLETEALRAFSPFESVSGWQPFWDAHQVALPGWLALVKQQAESAHQRKQVESSQLWRQSSRFWREQNAMDRLS